MDYQNKLTPNYFSTFFDERTMNVLPLLESAPLEANIYRYEPHEFKEAEPKFNKNPIPLNDFTLKRGEVLFERNCVFCHGEDGKGRGEIVTNVILKEDEEGFPQPKDLTSKSAKKLTDGRLFHILSVGQNLMFPFHDRLNSFDKWCIVHYIRKIQNLQ
ncbi:MAG: c-type cytochrome [Candidatus Kapaibacteriales bacterium]